MFGQSYRPGSITPALSEGGRITWTCQRLSSPCRRTPRAHASPGVNPAGERTVPGCSVVERHHVADGAAPPTRHRALTARSFLSILRIRPDSRG